MQEIGQNDIFAQMPNLPEPNKIAYLFGAGATHAELANLERDPFSEQFLEQRGLLTAYMSKRIMKQFQSKAKYLKQIEMVSSPSGTRNIELYISLIENSKVGDWQKTSSQLKKLVKKDIETILTKSKKKKFCLHRALLELHEQEKMKRKEKLIGLISLNYDNILDEAYKTVYKKDPNYCFVHDKDELIPLLKLHGSFSWKKVKIHGKRRNVQIIPLGVNKQYLHVPYNFIWIRALEILTECDILRVVGCSLSQNDTHLIALLFNAHIEKGKAFEIQLIDHDRTGSELQRNYGFFTEIKRLTEIEPPLIRELNPINPFKAWLKYKGQDLLKENVENTWYLKKVIT